jgi:hypothetical protein
MRCRKVQWLISDEIDGRLAARKRRPFEKHLSACCSCREYRERLRALQTKSVRTEELAVPAGYWDGSLVRLRKKLESIRPYAGAPERIRPHTGLLVPKWAWAGAAGLFGAAVGLYFVLVPSNKILERFPLSHEEAAGRLVAMIGDDESLETDFADLIQATILENSGEHDGDIRRLLYAESHFLDGLSEAELLRLDSHLAEELKI